MAERVEQTLYDRQGTAAPAGRCRAHGLFQTTNQIYTYIYIYKYISPCLLVKSHILWKIKAMITYQQRDKSQTSYLATVEVANNFQPVAQLHRLRGIETSRDGIYHRYTMLISIRKIYGISMVFIFFLVDILMEGRELSRQTESFFNEWIEASHIEI